MSEFEQMSRDWHAGTSQAKRVAKVATAEQVQRVWHHARTQITGPEDYYGLGFTGYLAYALDEEEVG